MTRRPGELERLLRGWFRRGRGARGGPSDEGPVEGSWSGWTAGPGLRLVEQRLRHVEEELAELRGRVNGLLFTVIGAVVVQIVLRLLG
jgi:hypothetical protein